jgi:hypothetical protein
MLQLYVDEKKGLKDWGSSAFALLPPAGPLGWDPRSCQPPGFPPIQGSHLIDGAAQLLEKRRLHSAWWGFAITAF